MFKYVHLTYVSRVKNTDAVGSVGYCTKNKAVAYILGVHGNACPWLSEEISVT